MSRTYTFKWPQGPEEVILTGTFDNWGKSLPLVKQADGAFTLTVPLPEQTEKLLYKYVVDGEWKTNPDERVTTDDSGNENNFLEGSDLVSASAFGSAIPEAGGLVTGAAHNEVAATVMPKQEQKQQTLGEAGIYVPKDPEQLKAFETVRDVDPKTLNEEELTAEEKKKQKKKVKRSQYKKKKKAAGQAAAVGASGLAPDAAAAALNETTTTEGEDSPEPEAAQAAAAAALAKVSDPKQAEHDKLAENEKENNAAAAEENKGSLDAAAVGVGAGTVVAGGLVAGSAAAEPAAVTADPVAAADPAAGADADANGEAVGRYSSLDPKATSDKEVDAAPGKPSYDSDEEIIVAHGNKADVEKAIRSTQGDVEVEEIKPTESEKERLTKEAQSQSKKSSPVKKVPVTAVKKDDKKDDKKKKKTGFVAKLKKIFS